MRHRKFTFKIGRTSAHRKALLANAACSVITEERITTTKAKGKQIRRLVDRMITLGKNGSLHSRRRAIAILRQKSAVATLFSDVAPRYEGRDGGYTRLMHVGRRVGDAAEMCILELVSEETGAALADGEAAAERASAPADDETADGEAT